MEYKVGQRVKVITWEEALKYETPWRNKIRALQEIWWDWASSSVAVIAVETVYSDGEYELVYPQRSPLGGRRCELPAWAIRPYHEVSDKTKAKLKKYFNISV